ncbi:MAG: hypothetical protein ACRDJM_04820 [Actinomycetota bacterium]
MDDRLRNLLSRAAQSVPPADQTRTPEIAGRVRRRRVGKLAGSAVAFVLAIGVVATAATLSNDSGRRPDFLDPAPASSGESVTEVSVSAEGGALRCIASIPSGTAGAGEVIEIRYVVRNETDQSLTYIGGRDFPSAYDESGREVWNLSNEIAFPLSGPPAYPRTLGPRASETMWSWSVRAMGSGLLSIDVKCPLQPKHGAGKLSPLRVRVTVPGPTPSKQQAVAQAVRASAGLFRFCEPTADGSWVNGRIVAPDGDERVPDMGAACRATVVVHNGFVSVAMEGASPDERHFQNSEPGVGPSKNTAWWRFIFVVTAEEARFVHFTGSLMSGATREPRTIPQYGFDGKSWRRGTFAACGTGGGPAFGFVSVCAR